MKNPFVVNTTDKFTFIFSGLADLELKPTLMCIKDGSGFRPGTTSDFGGSVSVSVGAVGISGANGSSAAVITGAAIPNSLAVAITSGTINATNNVTSVGVTGQNGASAQVLTGVGVTASLAVAITSGTINATNNVTQVGISGANGAAGVILTGVGTPNSQAVAITSGNVGVTNPLSISGVVPGVTIPVSGNVTVTNPNQTTKFGITGVDGAVGVILTGVGTPSSLAVAITSGNVGVTNPLSISGVVPGVTIPVSGNVNVTATNPTTKHSITGANGADVAVLTGVGFSSSLAVSITSGASNITQVGLTGNNGASATILTGAGFISSQAVAITSGVVGVTGTVTVTNPNPNTKMGISGSEGNSVTVSGGALSVSLIASTGDGLSTFSFVNTSGTNASGVKSTVGKIYGWHLGTVSSSPRYLKLYDITGTPTVGVTVPKMQVLIPGNSAGAGTNVDYTHGIAFTSGIAMALTTGIALLDSGVVSTVDTLGDLFYK